MNFEIEATDYVRTETFRYNEDGPGAYTIMVQQVNAGDRGPLSQAGYGGEHYIYHVYRGGKWWGSHDLRRFESEFTADDDKNLRRFLRRLERGAVTMDDIAEIGELTPADVTG